MKKLLVALLFAAQAIAQYPQISTQGPARPTMNVGGVTSNIGNVTAYTGSGAPTTVSQSATGDLYIDTTNHVFYVCVSGTNPCSSWQSSSSQFNVPVTAFGVSGNPSTDPANFAIGLSTMAGRGCLVIPQNFTVDLSTTALTIVPPAANVCLQGVDDTSIIKGSGVLGSFNPVIGFPINSTNVTLSNFQISGACNSATPTGVLYAAAQTNGPMWSQFVTGTSLAFSGGSSNINVTGVTINHTCGYAMLFDSSNGDISQVRLRGVKNINSRQFTFGINPSYLVYGSWTGGIFFFGTGTTYKFSDVVVEDSLFQNVVGNALWTHVQTLSVMNRNFTFTNNTCVDTGLDCIQVAAIDGYIETNNRSYRNGYVVTSDIGAARVGGPMWLQNVSPVSFDTSARVINAIRSNNLIDGENGEGIDGDGMGYSKVSDNYVIGCFASSDPLALSSQCGPYVSPGNPVTPGANNYVRGMSTNNSNFTTQVGNSISITGNHFIGMGGGGLQLFGVQNCIVSDNWIDQPYNAYYNPIVLGNLGNSTSQQAINNFVINNFANWLPLTSQPMIFEDDSTVSYSGTVNVSGTSVTWASGNQFNKGMAFNTIVISGTPYQILVYNSPTSVTLSSSAGTLSGAAYSITPSFTSGGNQIFGNRWTGNSAFVYEFRKGTGSNSTSGPLNLSSVTPGAPQGSLFGTVIQSEGSVTPTLNFYTQIAGIGVRSGTFTTTGFVPVTSDLAHLPGIFTAGQIVYCTNCTPNTRPCTAAVSNGGAIASSNGSQWNCGQ